MPVCVYVHAYWSIGVSACDGRRATTACDKQATQGSEARQRDKAARQGFLAPLACGAGACSASFAAACLYMCVRGCVHQGTSVPRIGASSNMSTSMAARMDGNTCVGRQGGRTRHSDEPRPRPCNAPVRPPCQLHTRCMPASHVLTPSTRVLNTSWLAGSLRYAQRRDFISASGISALLERCWWYLSAISANSARLLGSVGDP